MTTIKPRFKRKKNPVPEPREMLSDIEQSYFKNMAIMALHTIGHIPFTDRSEGD